MKLYRCSFRIKVFTLNRGKFIYIIWGVPGKHIYRIKKAFPVCVRGRLSHARDVTSVQFETARRLFDAIVTISFAI